VNLSEYKARAAAAASTKVSNGTDSTGSSDAEHLLSPVKSEQRSEGSGAVPSRQSFIPDTSAINEQNIPEFICPVPIEKKDPPPKKEDTADKAAKEARSHKAEKRRHHHKHDHPSRSSSQKSDRSSHTSSSITGSSTHTPHKQDIHQKHHGNNSELHQKNHASPPKKLHKSTSSSADHHRQKDDANSNAIRMKSEPLDLPNRDYDTSKPSKAVVKMEIAYNDPSYIHPPDHHGSPMDLEEGEVL